MVNILLVDDHHVVRNGIRLLLEKEGDIQVIAEAGNGDEALQLLHNGHKPDILVTAINLPGMSGIQLLAGIRKLYPAIKVAILSTLDDDECIIEAFKAGATAYMLKSIKAFELIYGIRHIHRYTDRFLCNQLSLKLLDRLLRAPQVNIKGNADIEVSKRELDVLTLLSEGYTNQEIANQLFTSKRTVETHRQKLIDKTGVRNTAALIRYAVVNNLIN